MSRGRPSLSRTAERGEASLSDGVALAFESVHKRWPGGSEVLGGLSLTVRCGEVVGLVGPNGSGKSTALGIASGLVRADRGVCLLFGMDSREPEARRSLGVVPDGARLPGAATVQRYLRRLAALAGGGDVDAAIEKCGLLDLRHMPLDHLSKGQRRRVLWAQALAHSPALLLLDEPFSGLDEPAREAMLGAVRARVAAGAAVLATSHRSTDLAALGARVVRLGASP